MTFYQDKKARQLRKHILTASLRCYYLYIRLSIGYRYAYSYVLTIASNLSMHIIFGSMIATKRVHDTTYMD